MNSVPTSYHELSFCHEKNEKKRCPQCGGFQTKRKGFTPSLSQTSRGPVPRKLQRYYCHSCHISFTSQGYGKRLRHPVPYQQEAVLDFVASKSSSREVAYRFGVTHCTILQWTQTLSAQMDTQTIPSPEDWSGYICFDGQESTVMGKKRVILIATDTYTRFPFLYQSGIAEDHKLTLNFLSQVADRYPVEITGITSDFGRGKCFVMPVATLFPEALHQICLVHYQRYLWQKIPRTRRSKFFWRNTVLKELIKRILKADTREDSQYWLDVLLHFEPFFRAKYHRRFLRSVRRNYARLTAYYDDDQLPTTNNVSENCNRQLKRKLKNLDGFKSDQAREYFIKLWFACYQLKRLKIDRKQWRFYLWNNQNRPN